MELRKNTNVAVGPESDQIFLVDSEGEHLIQARNTVGFPYFGELILVITSYSIHYTKLYECMGHQT